MTIWLSGLNAKLTGCLLELHIEQIYMSWVSIYLTLSQEND